jgi:hypothetical protein
VTPASSKKMRLRIYLAVVYEVVLGGLLPLAYLQETGYLGHGFDGADPIAPSSVSELVWLGLALLLGVGIRRLWDYLKPQVAGAA